LIEVNLVRRLVPSPFTTEMIASKMPAAIRPYSIAVAPDSSARNFFENVFHGHDLPAMRLSALQEIANREPARR
jgi:hypothetical protein